MIWVFIQRPIGSHDRPQAQEWQDWNKSLIQNQRRGDFPGGPVVKPALVMDWIEEGGAEKEGGAKTNSYISDCIIK